VPRADWSYQVPPAGSDSVGLEEYVVEDAAGQAVGKVMTLLDRRGDLYVAVERGTPPFTHDLIAVPLARAAEIDHAALVVRLDRDAFASGLELDPHKRTEDAHGVEARRLEQLPDALRPAPEASPAGPVEGAGYIVALVTGLLAIFSTLVIAIFATTTAFTWQFVFVAVPAILGVAAALFAYRAFRRQTIGRGLEKV
jgi:hypothetical protein